MWSNIGQQSAKVSDPVRLFSLLSLGEIGRHTYVSLKDFILFTYLFIFSFQENNLIFFPCYQRILLLINEFIYLALIYFGFQRPEQS